MKTHLVWFGNDLRIRDNGVLLAAREGADRLLAVYFFDPRQFEETVYGFKKTGSFRAKFLIETVTDLKRCLTDLNIPLLVYHDRPEAIMAGLVEEYQVDRIFKQREWIREESTITNKVRTLLPRNVEVEEQYDQFVFHPDDIPFQHFDEIPEVFTAFRKKCEKFSEVRAVKSNPEPMSADNLTGVEQPIPTLHDLGLEEFKKDGRSAFPFEGGESAAWKRLDQYFWKDEHLSRYKETRNGLVGADYSSKFSPWLANGSLSARSIYWQVRKFEKEINKNSSTYWLIFELIWRDYFKYISLKHGDKIFHKGGILNRSYRWKSDHDTFERWKNGNTPYPFVNANMNELARTGWMSNRGRQNVASYWARELEQDWRIGAAYFESMLIDYDVHSNWGNWMYNAGVGNDPRDRKFNINLQAQRYDPKEIFQNLWSK